MEEEVQTAAAPIEPAYTREALAASKKYREQCDIIMVALESDKQYTAEEAEEKIKAFLSQPVKEKINGKE